MHSSNVKKYLNILKKLTDKSNHIDSKIDLLEFNLRNIHTPKDGATIIDVKQIDTDQAIIELDNGEHFSINLPKGETGNVGESGTSGEKGRTGKDGISVSEIEKVNTTLKVKMSDDSLYEFVVKNGKDGLDGSPGVNGKDGLDGRNGLDGRAGRSGEKWSKRQKRYGKQKYF